MEKCDSGSHCCDEARCTSCNGLESVSHRPVGTCPTRSTANSAGVLVLRVSLTPTRRNVGGDGKSRYEERLMRRNKSIKAGRPEGRVTGFAQAVPVARRGTWYLLNTRRAIALQFGAHADTTAKRIQCKLPPCSPHAVTEADPSCCCGRARPPMAAVPSNVQTTVRVCTRPLRARPRRWGTRQTS
jgi:hypothetical protein